MGEMYGSSQAEQNLEKVMTCREIVKKIVEFGVTQEQILLIIQLLGYELENHDALVEVVTLTKQLLGNETPLFVARKEE